MEQYPIPQFIEAEGKIIFFLSFRQFFYMVGAGAICFVFYFTLPQFLFIVLSFIVLLIAAAFAFLIIDGVPLIDLIMHSIGFSMGGKDYTWKKKESPYPFKPIARTQIKKIDQGPVLQAQISQLKKLKTNVDLKTR
jgi:hypothetical protein